MFETIIDIYQLIPQLNFSNTGDGSSNPIKALAKGATNQSSVRTIGL